MKWDINLRPSVWNWHELELTLGAPGIQSRNQFLKQLCGVLWCPGRDSIYSGGRLGGNEVQRKPREEGVKFSHSLGSGHL